MQAHSLLDSRGVCVSFIDAECPVCVCVLDGCSVSCGGLFPATGLGMVLARISLYGITVCVCVCVAS